MYSKMFKKTSLKKENLWSYEGSDLQAFNDKTTHLWGYIELMIYMGEGKYVWTLNSQFLLVPCKNVYNCILITHFTSILEVVASPVHLKLKFQNLHNEPITVNVYLQEAKRIYQLLQQDQGEYDAMEINVASLLGQLRGMNIQPLKSGWPGYI